MKLICRQCGASKEACLFTPGSIEKATLAGPVCRKCVAGRAGQNFGGEKSAKKKVVESAKRTIVAYEKYFDRTFYAKKELSSYEVKSMVEARKRRIEDERRG